MLDEVEYIGEALIQTYLAADLLYEFVQHLDKCNAFTDKDEDKKYWSFGKAKYPSTSGLNKATYRLFLVLRANYTKLSIDTMTNVA